MGPPLKIYSAAQLRQAAEEYPTLPPVSRGMIRDYAVLRKVSRALSKQHGAAP